MANRIIIQNLPKIPQIHPTNALQILRETIRILRSKPSIFMSIFAILILPFSSIFLSNFLLNQPTVSFLGHHLVLLSAASGLPNTHFVKQLCHHLAATLISSAFCFPILITLLVFARAFVAFSVASIYAGKKVAITDFKELVVRIARGIVLTYICCCVAISGFVGLFVILVVGVCRSFFALGYPPEIVAYPALVCLFGFSVGYAYLIVVCNVSLVICVLEDVFGLVALGRSARLVEGRMKAGLVMFCGVATGLGFVEGLFEHRVKSLSYGDGSSRIWEAPLLVVMYSFVVLVDCMMSAVFYFGCRSCGVEVLDEGMVGELEKLSFESTIDR